MQPPHPGVAWPGLAWLCSVELVRPKRTPTLAQDWALDQAMAAQPTCPRCRRRYYLAASAATPCNCLPGWPNSSWSTLNTPKPPGSPAVPQAPPVAVRRSEPGPPNPVAIHLSEAQTTWTGPPCRPEHRPSRAAGRRSGLNPCCPHRDQHRQRDGLGELRQTPLDRVHRQPSKRQLITGGPEQSSVFTQQAVPPPLPSPR